MKARRPLLVLLIFGSAAALCVWYSRKAEPRRPNVLLVTIDTLRADRLGCYGWKGATSPTLDGRPPRARASPRP